MLARLEIGLADEGVRVVHAIPEEAASEIQTDVFSAPLVYPRALPWASLRGRAKQIVQMLDRSKIPTDEIGFDVVHVFGGAAWDLGLELGRELDAHVMLEVWRAGLVDRAIRLANPRSGVTPTLLVPDGTLEREVRALDARVPVRLAVWGVHTSSGELPPQKEGRAKAIMLAATGRDARALASALEGIALALKRGDQSMVFIDATAARRANLWNVARRLNILDHVSLIDDMEGTRELVLRGDLFVYPETRGEQRTLLLDAMAHGMAIIAHEDPMVGWLENGRTARLLDSSDPDDWGEAVGALIDDPAGARELGEAAREYVRVHHRVSMQVRDVLDAYSAAGGDRTIPFPTRT